MPSPRSFNPSRTTHPTGTSFPTGTSTSPSVLQICTFHRWLFPELQTSLVNQLPSRWHHCTCPQSSQTNSITQMGLIFPIPSFFTFILYWDEPPLTQDWKAKTQASLIFSSPLPLPPTGEHTFVWLPPQHLSDPFPFNTLVFTLSVIAILSNESHFFQFVLLPIPFWIPN